MNLTRQKAVLVHAGYALLIAATIYIALRYLLVFLLPFMVGFLIAWFLRPVAGFLHRHSGLNRRGASIVSALIFYLLLAVLLWLLSYGIAVWIQHLRAVFPELLSEDWLPFLSGLGERLHKLTHSVDGMEDLDIEAHIEQALNGLLSKASGSVMNAAGKMMQKLPLYGLATIFTIMSSVLICADYDKVTAFVLRQIPQRLHGILLEVRDFMVRTLLHLVRAYLILMVITFLLISAGLWMLHIRGFFLAAAVIAILDLLPIIGSGVVLLPWAALALLGGDLYTGCGLLAVWTVVSVVRQILEPKIIGDQIGLHPLASLTAMYVGFRLAGFAGLLAAPLLCLLLQYLHDRGVIRLPK